MRLRPPDKDAARDLQRRCDDASGAASVATAGSSVVALALGQSVELSIAVGALFTAAAADLGRRAGRVADDPPRKNFKQSTHVSVRPLRIEALMRRATGRQLEETGRPLGDLLQERLRDCGVNAFQASAYLDAMVRAYERAMGALESDAPEFVYLRASEAGRHAQGAARVLASLARRAEGVPEALEREVELRSAVARSNVRQQLLSGPRRLIQYLPDAAMASLYEAGIRITELEALRVPWPSEDPWGDASKSIAALGATARDTADALSGWEPLEA